MQITVSPREESPSELRALALMLNTLASDRDAGKAPEVTVDTPPGITVTATITQDALPKSQPGTADAAGASEGSTQTQSGAASAPVGLNTSESTLDVNGLPWDARIHSSSKGRNQDQSWKALRGVDKSIVPGIEAELRAKLAGSTDDAPPPPPPLPDAKADDAPPPPPPIVTQADEPEVSGVTTQEVFKRASQLAADLRTQCLEAVGLGTMGDFLKEVKTRPALGQELWDAIVMITGDE